MRNYHVILMLFAVVASGCTSSKRKEPDDVVAATGGAKHDTALARQENASFAEMHWKEGLVMAPLIGLIVFLGVYPKPVLERIQPSVDALIAHVEDQSCAAENGTCYHQPENATPKAQR